MESTCNRTRAVNFPGGRKYQAAAALAAAQTNPKLEAITQCRWSALSIPPMFKDEGKRFGRPSKVSDPPGASMPLTEIKSCFGSRGSEELAANGSPLEDCISLLQGLEI